MTSEASLGEREVYEFQYSPAAPAPEEPADDLHAEPENRGPRRPRVQARILGRQRSDRGRHRRPVTARHRRDGHAPLNIDQECSIELGISVASLATPPMLRALGRVTARSMAEGRFRIGMKFTTVSIEAAELLVEALELDLTRA